MFLPSAPEVGEKAIEGQEAFALKPPNIKESEILCPNPNILPVAKGI